MHTFVKIFLGGQLPDCTSLLAGLTYSTCKEKAEVAEVTFSDADSTPVPKYLHADLTRSFFKFDNPTPVQSVVKPLTEQLVSGILEFSLMTSSLGLTI